MSTLRLRVHRRWSRLFAVGCAACLAALTATGGQAAATTSIPAVPGHESSDPLGVVVGPDGWLTYTNTLSARVQLTNAASRTVAGRRAPDGSCETSGSMVIRSGSASNFEEEVAFNPSTCAERIVTGTLDPSGLAMVNALTSGRTASATVTPPGAVRPPSAAHAPAGNPARLSTSAKVSTQSKARLAATSFDYAYTKTAWIDPFYITITSLTSNIQYPLWGSGQWVYYWPVPYEFPLDGWSSSGVTDTFSYLYPADTYGWQAEAVDHFTNTDFATFIYSTMGLSGWLACGARFTVTAHFNHDVIVQGFANGNRGAGWNDSVNGACANLVHHAAWSGWGTSS
jgi:hypothetical protein